MPTPAGNLLGRPIFDNDNEGGEDLGDGQSAPCKSGMDHRRQTPQQDVEPHRDQDGQSLLGGLCNSALALKRSSSLAARRRYAQSAAALGDGVEVGVCIAPGGMEGRKGKSLPITAGALGSGRGVDAGVGKAHRDSSQGQDQQVFGAEKVGTQTQWGGDSSTGGEEEDDLAHLMCDECDFVTPPHSPTSAAHGACSAGSGQGAEAASVVY